MKNVLTLIAVAFGMVSTAWGAQVTWEAYSIPSDYASGTAYLISVSSGVTTTSDAIASYLSNTGTSYTGSDYSLMAQAPVSTLEDLGTYTTDEQVLASLSPQVEYTYFVVVLDSTGTSYAVSEISSFTIESEYHPDTYAGAGANGWITGKVYQVPEPTVLALLALGVAGLALRRKTVA